MTDNDFFMGVMVLKDGKWTPHSKFEGSALASALSKAEELDKQPDFEGVRVLKIPAGGKGEQKEMWASPHIRARSEIQAQKNLRDGVRETKEKLAEARKSSAKKL